MKRRLANLGLILIGVVLGTLLAEGLVRLAIDIPLTPQMFVSDPVTDFRLKPNVSERLAWPGDVRFSWTTNSRGYRATPELTVPKPASVRRVLMLGDSFTFGQGVDDAQTYVAEVRRRLKSHCPTIRAEIVNAGVPGFSTSQELAMLEDEGLALEPDVVVLGFYGNDPEDNLRRGVFLLAGNTLVQRPAAARPRLYRLKAFVDRVPGYAWLASRSHLFNLVRRALVAGSAGDGFVVAAGDLGRGEAGTSSRAGDPPAALGFEEYQWRLMRALLARMDTVVQGTNSRLMVLLIPDTADIRRLSALSAPSTSSATPVARMRSLCTDLALECLDFARWLASTRRFLREDMLYIQREFHFTPLGNALAGEFLASELAPALGCPSRAERL